MCFITLLKALMYSGVESTKLVVDEGMKVELSTLISNRGAASILRSCREQYASTTPNQRN